MGFRFGSRRRKEKKAEKDNERAAKQQEKKGGKKTPEDKRVTSRPPPVPGSKMKSRESRASTASSSLYPPSSSTPHSRNVLFRDNRLPDGSTMPRIQPSPIPEKRGSSPTPSILSSASIPPTFPSFASYPASYIPNSPPYPPTDLPQRGRIQSDNSYPSALKRGPVYDEPMPPPDYPRSNDGTGNSNRDSGLDTESRSSSGGCCGPKQNYGSYNVGRYNRAAARRTPLPGEYNQSLSRARNFSQQRAYSSSLPLGDIRIVRPRGYQEPEEAVVPSIRSRPTSAVPVSSLSSRFRKAASLGSLGYAAGPPPTAKTWTFPEEEEEPTYRPRSRQPHCSSCSCCDEPTARSVRSTNTLRRIQLEEGPTRKSRWNEDEERGATSRSRRRFRRDDEDEETLNAPSRGRFFEEQDEQDRYGRLPPLKKVVYGDVDDFDDETSDYRDESPSYDRRTTPAFQRPSLPSDFYRRNAAPSVVSRDVSVIRL